jgi:hypothetical protein
MTLVPWPLLSWQQNCRFPACRYNNRNQWSVTHFKNLLAFIDLTEQYIQLLIAFRYYGMNIFVIDVAHTVPWHTVRVSCGYRRLIPKGWTQYIRVSRQCTLTSSWYGDTLTLFCLLFRLSQPYSKHSWRRVITRHEMRNYWHWCQIWHPPRYRVAPGATWWFTTQQILFPTIRFYRHFTWPTLNTEKHGYVENRIARWWCFQLMNYFELWNTQSITTWI